MGNAGYGNHTEDTKSYVESKRTDSNIADLPENATEPGTTSSTARTSANWSGKGRSLSVSTRSLTMRTVLRAQPD